MSRLRAVGHEANKEDSLITRFDCGLVWQMVLRIWQGTSAYPGNNFSIVVCDRAGQQIASLTMDMASPVSMILAHRLARTAAYFERETPELGRRGSPLDLAAYRGLELCFLDGGVTLLTEDTAWKSGPQLIGGVGVSSGVYVPAEDESLHREHELAKLGADWFRNETRGSAERARAAANDRHSRLKL